MSEAIDLAREVSEAVSEHQRLLREIRRNEAFLRAAGHDVETYHSPNAVIEQRSN